MDEEIEAGKQSFIKLVREIEPETQIVIPTQASSDHFLISLTKGGNREFISISEGDLLDLDEVAVVRKEVVQKVQEALQKIGG